MATTTIEVHVASPAASHDAVPGGLLARQHRMQVSKAYPGPKTEIFNRSISATEWISK